MELDVSDERAKRWLSNAVWEVAGTAETIRQRNELKLYKFAGATGLSLPENRLDYIYDDLMRLVRTASLANSGGQVQQKTIIRSELIVRLYDLFRTTDTNAHQVVSIPACDLGWLEIVRAGRRPVLVYAAISTGSSRPSSLEFLIVLFSKYSLLHPPVVTQAGQPVVRRAADLLSVEFSPSEVRPDTSTDAFHVCIGHPPADLKGAEGCLLTADPLLGVQTLPTAVCAPEIGIYLLLVDAAAQAGRLLELEGDFLRFPAYARPSIRRLQGQYWPNHELAPETPTSGLDAVPFDLVIRNFVSQQPPLLNPSLADIVKVGDVNLVRRLLARSTKSLDGLSVRGQAQRLCLEAHLSLAEGNCDLAVNGLRQALKHHHYNPAALALATLLAYQGHTIEATAIVADIDAADESVAFEKALAEAWICVSEQRPSSEQFATIELLSKLQHDEPAFREYSCARLFLAVGAISDAWSFALSACSRTPSMFSCLLLRSTIALTCQARGTPVVRAEIIEQWLHELVDVAQSQGLVYARYLLNQLLGLELILQATRESGLERRRLFGRGADYLEKGLDPSHFDPVLSETRANALLHSDRAADAIKAYGSIPLSARSPAGFSDLIAAHLLLKDVEGALIELQKLREWDQVTPELVANIGLLFLAANDPQGALSVFDIPGLRVHFERSWRLQYIRGQALHALGRYDLAERALRSAIDGNSHSPKLFSAHLSAYKRSIGIFFPDRASDLLTDTTLPSFEKDTLKELLARLGSFLAQYEEQIERFWDIPSGQRNGIHRYFERSIEMADLFQDVLQRLDALAEERALSRQQYIARLREILARGRQTSFQSGDSRGSTNTLARETNWVPLLKSLADDMQQRSPIQLDLRSAEILENVSRQKTCTPSDLWLHLNAIRLGMIGSEERLRVYDFVRGIERKPYQQAAIERVVFQMYGRAILADEVGLGKTIEAGLILAEYIIRGLVRSCLILVPTWSLALQWKQELEEKLNIRQAAEGMAIQVFDGGTIRRPDDQMLRGIVIVTHSTAVRRTDFMTLQCDMVICDEAHHATNRNSSRYQLLRRLKARYLLLLTGTPIQNSIEDLYSLASLVRPSLFGSLSAFRARFCIAGRSHQIRDVQSLALSLSQILVRNTRRAVAGESSLAKRVLVDATVELRSEERRFYENVVNTLKMLDNVDSPIVDLTVYSLLRALCSCGPAAVQMLARLALGSGRHSQHEALFRASVEAASLLPSAKLMKLKSIVDDHRHEKIIVFTEFRETAALIASQIGGVYPDNRLDSDDVRRKLEAFMHDGGETVLVATPRLAEGLNLQACRVVVNFDLPWNPFKLEQRIGRVQRLRQAAKEVIVYVMCAEGTFESVIRDLLLKKLKLFETAIGQLSIPWSDLAEGRSIETRIRDLISKASNLVDLEEKLGQLYEYELRPLFTSPSITIPVDTSAPMSQLDTALMQVQSIDESER